MRASILTLSGRSEIVCGLSLIPSPTKTLNISLFPVLLLVALFCVNSQAQTYSGQSYAVKVTETKVGQPVLTTSIADTGDLATTGGNINLTSVGVSLLAGAVSIGSSTTSTSGSGAVSQSAASINSINIGVLSNTISAGVVSANTTAGCPGQTLHGTSNVASLQINGSGVTILGTPNQTVQILLGGNPVGTLIINEEIIHPRSITRNALHLIVQDPLDLTVTEVIVSSARSGINCAIAPQFDIYSGRGTALQVTQDDRLLTGHITTLVSDTGWLPSSGGSISATTTGAGVLGLVSTGVTTANSIGGSPVGTTASQSRVDNLGVNLLGAVSITANVLEANTFCSCSLSIGTCGGNSSVAGLAVNVLGLPVIINITGAPNQVVNIPVLGLGNVTLVINEQFGSPNGNPAHYNVNALRINTNLLGLISTQVIAAKSHSGIVCGIAPSSANVSIAGKVSDSHGNGMVGAYIRVTDAESNIMTGTTNNLVTTILKDFEQERLT
ncbi:choice-of-anchor P family protein [Leptolyngbya sp. 7M]|uniref:choice-of-anchor P family protein n=1 Tax=Leptolyngbya sp. 7M TaxID=2812896 RepID=UPI0028F44503|nr:choice-of-anchor P family protein [Leptolyngbya sp. 7M]